MRRWWRATEGIRFIAVCWLLAIAWVIYLVFVL